MSLVREVSLVSVNGQPRLVQLPVPEVRATSTPGPLQQMLVDGSAAIEGGAAVQLLDVTFTPGSAEEFGLVVRGSADSTVGTRIGIRPGNGELLVDRTQSGDTAFHDAFPSISRAPITAGRDGSYTLQVFVDHCSVEVFANNGLATVTELIFPDPAHTSLTLYSVGDTVGATFQLTVLEQEKPDAQEFLPHLGAAPTPIPISEKNVLTP